MKDLGAWVLGLTTIVALNLGWCTPAQCQYRWDRFSITPQLTLTGEFNDNIFLVSVDKLAKPPIDKEEEYSIRLVPALELAYLGDKFGAKGRYRAEFRHHVNNSSANEYGKDHSAGISAWQHVSRHFTWGFADNFSASTDPLRWAEGRSEEGALMARDTFNDETILFISNRTSADCRWSISKEFRISLAAQGELSQFGDTVGSQDSDQASGNDPTQDPGGSSEVILYDTSSVGGRISLGYDVWKNTSIECAFRATHYDFSALGTAGTQELSLGVRQTLGKHSTGRVRAGVANVTERRSSDDGAEPLDERNWRATWAVSVDREFEHLSVGLRANQTIAGGGGLAGTTTTRGVAFNALYMLLADLEMNTIVRYTKTESLSAIPTVSFDDEGNPIEIINDVDMETQSAGLSLRYKFMEGIEGTIEYQFARQVPVGGTSGAGWDSNRILAHFRLWLPEMD